MPISLRRKHGGSSKPVLMQAGDTQTEEQQQQRLQEQDAELAQQAQQLPQMEDEDDISDSAAEEVVKKSRRPKENAFTQQKLKAVHPILTPNTVIPLLLVIAVIFIPIGAAMLYGSNKVEELVIDYSQYTELETTMETGHK
ncbi:unnamed protein product [Ambrosiozyma monospora]|uniref:Unnamed protein product n=1 Tax=Ambrosiozyma monospora TaxID=43982 RepID=A0ACB5TZJ7_AMBMO|nr:unnamed protein product [Ambrosiozyma monospora]